MASPARGIAEKPTYSRGTDGKYPYGIPSFQKTISDLKSETLAKSNLAQSAGRGLAAPKDYFAADASYKQIAVVKQAEQVFRKKQEVERQADERANLTKAYKIERARFEEEWALRISEVEAACVEKEQILKEVHGLQCVDVEKEIAKKVAGMRYKKSSHLLNSQAMERKLATSHDFRGAAEVTTRAYRMKRAEEAAFEREKAKVGVQPRKDNVEAQAAEMRNCLQKCHALRVTVRREKEQAFEVFKQKYRNLEADLTHAHAIEYSLRPEIGAVHAHQSRSQQASTFRGTLKYESLAGTKFDVPDVSSLAPITSLGGDDVVGPLR